ncbi:MAG: phage tail protein [Burkholderiales bacterium]|nr:phage tail protein [Burkholderiales bacterium]
MKPTRASEFWAEREASRSGLLDRFERYAAMTIPKVLHPEEYQQKDDPATLDYQSLGAQGVTHLSNKLMLAMFAPSRPFLKLQVVKDFLKKALALGVSETQLNETLVEGERSAIKKLDSLGQRPKLFQIMRHLIVVGNCLLVLEKKAMRVISIRNYVVKRNIKGEVIEACIREHVRFDELDPSIQRLLTRQYTDESKVYFYKWLKREQNGQMSMTQWVEEVRLPKEFNGRWAVDKCPYQILTWDLSDDADYGTGLVEEYARDFEAISVLSEALVNGGVLAAEFRWMVNPNGVTQVEDVAKSNNGDALPGLESDVKPVMGGNPKAIEVLSVALDRWERRVSRGFLMGSAIIRDAERVTQEEVRMTANELETAYGGVYSTLAASLQKPVGLWLLDASDVSIQGTQIEITIVTGLDALSRNGDLENFRLAMGDMAQVAQLPEAVQARLKWDEIKAFIGQGRNVDLNKFMMTDAEFAKKQEAAMATQMANTVGTEAGVAAVQQGPQ